ncbi:hypothetical protein NE237_012549 [Protea cynaroides]|uniref:Uncharacterized protein n=1 Tax=Protea cynaroides TaxID=273540 RepID=A0A9Q0GZC0_9MAGN|nr:hypothetical protein NE237_012549 [Protea cynaroides]
MNLENFTRSFHRKLRSLPEDPPWWSTASSLSLFLQNQLQPPSVLQQSLFYGSIGYLSPNNDAKCKLAEQLTLMLHLCHELRIPLTNCSGGRAQREPTQTGVEFGFG